MTDRELLENAAKAVGLKVQWSSDMDCFEYAIPFRGSLVNWEQWIPLEDDGDALRLAVALGLSIILRPACVQINYPKMGLPTKLIGVDGPLEDLSDQNKDANSAVCRAIVRAAAAIGETL